VFTPAEAIRLVRERAADAVSIKVMKSGGILPARRIAEIAEAAGLAAYGGTMFEGGIALSAGMHLVAATRNISLGAEFYTATYVLEQDVLTTPVRQVDGKTQVPTGPGLGIEVDRAVLERYTVALRG
jgi:muconate cycloisomerase